MKYPIYTNIKKHPFETLIHDPMTPHSNLKPTHKFGGKEYRQHNGVIYILETIAVHPLTGETDERWVRTNLEFGTYDRAEAWLDRMVLYTVLERLQV
jgi:hypothetical protein